MVKCIVHIIFRECEFCINDGLEFAGLEKFIKAGWIAIGLEPDDPELLVSAT